MAVYRVWSDEGAESYWLDAPSETDAIGEVQLAFGYIFGTAELRVVVGEGHSVPDGVILIGTGEAFPDKAGE